MPSAQPLTIAQVSPVPFGSGHEIDLHVRALSDDLAARGHRVLLLAPAASSDDARTSRALIRRLREEPDAVAELCADGPLVLGVGEAIALATAAPRRSSRPLPVDVTRTIEELLTEAPPDIVHVHDPFAPSLPSAALRHSISLNVGTFHTPTERFLSAQLARKAVALVLGRLDARVTTLETTRTLMQRAFPARYEVIPPGIDAGGDAPATDDGAAAPHVLVPGVEERAATRIALRAIRRLDASAADWRATILGPPPAAPLRADLRGRVTFREPREHDADALLAGADVVVLASHGERPAPGLLGRALARGAVPVASRIPLHDELLGEGERGLVFEPGDVETLAAQLQRVLGDDALRARLRSSGRAWAADHDRGRAADAHEALYARLRARRHHDPSHPDVRVRTLEKPLIDVDLHMHTDHSHDCATPVEALLATARDRGLGAIAVTDHNEVSGALDAARKAAGYGVKVIVGEEVKTASQGEVIGLFLQEKIPRGLTLQETIAEIKRQGGVVYVPHPFDRMHAVPDYEHLLDVLDDVDAIEVYNPRVAIGSFNDEAVRFAAKYGITAGAGSDSHVTAGLGSVRIRMHDFDGPEEFKASLRRAEIIRGPSSLLYVQALKFIETTAIPAPARRARRERRVRRAVRKS